jgi:hypothetical protein
MSTDHVTSPAGTNFFSLPAELRNMIFSHLLIRPHAIQICSPSKHGMRGRKYRVNRSEPLFGVNKEMHEGASYYFFSQNTFMLGNGMYGSSSVPNLHGLRAFFRRVPARHVRYITKLKMTIHLRKIRVVSSLFNRARNITYLLGNKEDVRTFRSLFNSLSVHFPDLQSLQIQCEEGEWLHHAYGYNPEPYPVDPSREMAKALRAIFKCKHLENVTWKVDPWVVDLKEADEKLRKLMLDIGVSGWNHSIWRPEKMEGSQGRSYTQYKRVRIRAMPE